jgi:hypothetical protein
VTKEASIHEFFFSKVFEFMSLGLLALAADMRGSDQGLPKCPHSRALPRGYSMKHRRLLFFELNPWRRFAAPRLIFRIEVW